MLVAAPDSHLVCCLVRSSFSCGPVGCGFCSSLLTRSSSHPSMAAKLAQPPGYCCGVKAGEEEGRSLCTPTAAHPNDSPTQCGPRCAAPQTWHAKLSAALMPYAAG